MSISALALAACSGSEEGAEPAEPSEAPVAAAPSDRADLGAVKTYLLDHTGLLSGSGRELAEQAARYYELAEQAGFDYAALWSSRSEDLGPLVLGLKDLWIEANPYYERVEGVVAGTPSLAEYDVILDAGSSAADDPESAVPFDLTLPDGRVLAQPGNLFNLTEGALWGTLPADLGVSSTPADLDGNGQTEFGEVLPDAAFFLAATQAFERYADELDVAANAWQPADSDAFTALVVMVPTMSEYFGQWKESRFVAGDTATSQAFNVVSRLSDIRDILGGLEVIYAGVEPLVATVDEQRSAQTGQELADLGAFIGDLYEQEQAGNRFEPEDAETLGSEAQERATAIAGQVSQAAAQLGITIEQ